LIALTFRLFQQNQPKADISIALTNIHCQGYIVAYVP